MVIVGRGSGTPWFLGNRISVKYMNFKYLSPKCHKLGYLHTYRISIHIASTYDPRGKKEKKKTTNKHTKSKTKAKHKHHKRSFKSHSNTLIQPLINPLSSPYQALIQTLPKSFLTVVQWDVSKTPKKEKQNPIQTLIRKKQKKKKHQK